MTPTHLILLTLSHWFFSKLFSKKLWVFKKCQFEANLWPFKAAKWDLVSHKRKQKLMQNFDSLLVAWYKLNFVKLCKIRKNWRLSPESEKEKQWILLNISILFMWFWNDNTFHSGTQLVFQTHLGMCNFYSWEGSHIIAEKGFTSNTK